MQVSSQAPWSPAASTTQSQETLPLPAVPQMKILWLFSNRYPALAEWRLPKPCVSSVRGLCLGLQAFLSQPRCPTQNRFPHFIHDPTPYPPASLLQMHTGPTESSGPLPQASASIPPLVTSSSGNIAPC